MKQTIRFGRISGVEVGANWSLLVLILLVADGLATAVLPQLAPGYSSGAYWTAGVVCGLLIAGSLLLHELAHSVVAQRAGIPVQRITLWMLGGASVLDGEPATPRTAFWIAASGPLTSLGLGLGSGTIAVLLNRTGVPGLIVMSLWWLGIMNVFLAVFNLLPGLPLDGGRILRAALWWRSGDPNQAAISAGRGGQVIGYLLTGLGFAEWLSGSLTGLWLVMIGFVIITSVTAESRLTRLRISLGQTTVRAAMSQPEVTAYVAMPVERFVTEVAPRTREAVFPVVDLDGAPTGTVALHRLARVPATRRASTTIADVQRPLADVPVAHPDDLLADLVSRMSPAPDELALVIEHDRLVGVFRGQDIARLVHLAAFRPAAQAT
ncbi:site-2 protease family protein [Kribbella solani]|uniref:Zinc metalloprotease n=1 Tax=Kribbella solani TaxID=236067 RepID=A0A841DKQ8_9ACTN|nr:site-2 protease family protein [Kribbella solani]MBB5978481.1 Zn-dependent protease [Kribbella solani]